MKASGELGIRKHQSFENLMNMAAQTLDGTQKAFFDTPRTIYEGMRENFEEFRNDITDGLERISDSITEIRDRIHDGADGK